MRASTASEPGRGSAWPDRGRTGWFRGRTRAPGVGFGTVDAQRTAVPLIIEVSAMRKAAVLLDEPRDGRQAEGEGLPGTGPATTEDVSAGQGIRDRRGLDG